MNEGKSTIPTTQDYRIDDFLQVKSRRIAYMLFIKLVFAYVFHFVPFLRVQILETCQQIICVGEVFSGGSGVSLQAAMRAKSTAFFASYHKARLEVRLPCASRVPSWSVFRYSFLLVL